MRLLIVLILALAGAAVAVSRSGPDRHAPAPAPAVGATPAAAHLHLRHVDRFVREAGFGLSRMRASLEDDEAQLEDGRYRVVRHDLIGVRGDPRAYVTAGVSSMDDLPSAPTRDLTPFEKRALARLRAGREVVREGANMAGAVRARTECLDCHGGREGDLLGAFSYVLERTGATAATSGARATRGTQPRSR